PVSAYRALTRHRDQKRMFAALEELISARILIVGAERSLFSQQGFASVLLAMMSDQRKAQLHSRMAELLAGGDVVDRAEHLMNAGRSREAIQLLCGIDLLARLPPLPLLEQARAIGASCSMAGTTFDLELVESLPSLEPLLPLSPSLRVVEQIWLATHDWLSGRVRRSIERHEQTLARLAEPDNAGMDEAQHKRT